MNIALLGCAIESEPIDVSPDDEPRKHADPPVANVIDTGDEHELPPPHEVCCGAAFGEGPCWPGDAVVSTRAELQQLWGFRGVSGSLRIDMDDEIAVAGLDQLRCVGGDLTITGNALENVDGLYNLEYVGGHAMIEEVPRLASLRGLRSLARVAGELRVRRADKLTNLDGLGSVAAVGHLVVAENPLLGRIATLGTMMRSVDGTLLVYNNPLLEDISGLFGVAQVGSHIWIESNTSLPTCKVKQWLDYLVAAGFDGEITLAGNDDNAACS